MSEIHSYRILVAKQLQFSSQSVTLIYLLPGHGFMSVQQTLELSPYSEIKMYLLRGHGFMSVQQTLQFSSRPDFLTHPLPVQPTF